MPLESADTCAHSNQLRSQPMFGHFLPPIYPMTGGGYILGSMSKRLIDIDDELLRKASAVLGAPTMKEAVNRALESVVVADRRQRHTKRLETMRGLDLDKPKVMAGAWR